MDLIQLYLNYQVIIKQDGHYTDEEIAIFKTVVERGSDLFFKYARQGGHKL